MAGGKTTEPQPLGSTSGKRGYIRSCLRCGPLPHRLADRGHPAGVCPLRPGQPLV